VKHLLKNQILCLLLRAQFDRQRCSSGNTFRFLFLETCVK
jgi:hypothetical protein